MLFLIRLFKGAQYQISSKICTPTETVFKATQVFKFEQKYYFCRSLSAKPLKWTIQNRHVKNIHSFPSQNIRFAHLKPKHSLLTKQAYPQRTHSATHFQKGPRIFGKITRKMSRPNHGAHHRTALGHWLTCCLSGQVNKSVFTKGFFARSSRSFFVRNWESTKKWAQQQQRNANISGVYSNEVVTWKAMTRPVFLKEGAVGEFWLFCFWLW